MTDSGAEYESGGPQTRVGHCKQDSTDVYAGRGPDGRAMDETEIGERGWLGNPFSVEEYSREESLERFKGFFNAKLETSPKFRHAIADLSGSTLGCWCQSLDEDEPACHAEVIAEKSDRLREMREDLQRGVEADD